VTEPRLFTPAFGILIGANLLQSLGWTSMILLPLYLDHLGASRAEIGAIISAARVGGLLSRPGIGWALDRVGRKPTLIVGTAVVVVGMWMVWPVERIGPLIYAARAVFGVGMGCLFTGYFTFAADIIPVSRRTEGIALFGIAGLAPLAIGPLVERAGIQPADVRWFIPVVGFFVLGSAIGVALVPDKGRAPTTDKGGFSMSKVVAGLGHRSLWPVWLAALGFSGLVVLFMAFAAVTAEGRGIENPSSLWLTYSAGAVGVRVFGARLPDRIGNHNLVAPAFGVYVLAAILLAGADTELGFLAGGLLAGLAHGYCFPVLTSQVVTRAPDELRGSAMAMFTWLWDMSALVISPLLGFLADNHGDAMMYATTAAATVVLLAVWAVLEHRSAT